MHHVPTLFSVETLVNDELSKLDRFRCQFGTLVALYNLEHPEPSARNTWFAGVFEVMNMSAHSPSRHIQLITVSCFWKPGKCTSRRGWSRSSAEALQELIMAPELSCSDLASLAKKLVDLLTFTGTTLGLRCRLHVAQLSHEYSIVLAPRYQKWTIYFPVERSALESQATSSKTEKERLVRSKTNEKSTDAVLSAVPTTCYYRAIVYSSPCNVQSGWKKIGKYLLHWGGSCVSFSTHRLVKWLSGKDAPESQETATAQAAPRPHGGCSLLWYFWPFHGSFLSFYSLNWLNPLYHSFLIYMSSFHLFGSLCFSFMVSFFKWSKFICMLCIFLHCSFFCFYRNSEVFTTTFGLLDWGVFVARQSFPEEGLNGEIWQTSNKGIATSKGGLLVAPALTTRSRDAASNKGHRYKKQGALLLGANSY